MATSVRCLFDNCSSHSGFVLEIGPVINDNPNMPWVNYYLSRDYIRYYVNVSGVHDAYDLSFR